MKAILKKLINRTTAALLFSATLIAVLVGVVGGKTPTMPRSVDAITASADEETFDPNYQNYGIADSNYQFESGAAILKTTNEDGSHKFNYMSFVLQLKNPDMRNFAHEKDITKYTFTLYRKNEDTKNYPLHRFIITRQNNTILGIQQYITDFGGSFDLAQSQAQGVAIKTYDSAVYDKFVEDYKEIDGNYNLQSAYVSFGEKKLTQDIVWKDDTAYFDYPYLRFVVNVPSLDDQYFVRFEYEIKKFVKTDYYNSGFLWLKKNYFDWYEDGKGGKSRNGYSGVIDSDIRSSKGVLENMQSQGALAEEFPDEALREQAEMVLAEQEYRTITVSYLERIGETSFARRVEKTGKFAFPASAANSATLGVREICSKFEIPYNVLGSNIDKIVMDTSGNRTDYYEAIYYEKAVYVTARTSSGNTVDPTEEDSGRFFLGLETFSDYFLETEDKGYLVAEQCTVMYNRLLTENADLQGYRQDEVYGYWGHVLVPSSLNLRDLWSRVFDTKTSIGGVRIMDDYTRTITMVGWDDYVDYISLLNDYQYHFYETLTSAITSAITPVGGQVTHYTFYADTTAVTEDSFIGENGAENANDSQSALGKTTEEVTKELLQMSMELNEQLQNSASGVTTPWESRGFRVVFAIATVGGVLIGGVYLYVRYGGLGGSDVHVNIDSEGGATTKKKSSPAKKTTAKKKK